MKDVKDTYIAIYAAAIRHELWRDMYEDLKKTNECKVKIFYCGHKRPEASLPDDVVYLYSDMSPAACAEIAYRCAMASNPDFVFNYWDDLYADPGMLDKLINAYHKFQAEYPDKDVVVAPGFRPNRKGGTPAINLQQMATSGSGKILCLGSDSGLGSNHMLVKKELAERVGGLDKRWVTGCPGWVEDLTLRLELLGVMFKACQEAQCAEWDDYRKGDHSSLPAGRRLSLRMSDPGNPERLERMGPDVALYNELWLRNPGETLMGKYKKRCEVMAPDYPLQRKDAVQFYTEEDLSYHQCRYDCKNHPEEKKR